MLKTLKSATLLTLLVGGGLVLLAGEPDKADKAEKPRVKPYVVVFDFHCDADARYGKNLADKLRLRLGRHAGEFEVIDRLTTQEASGPLSVQTDRKKIIALLDNLAANVAVVATVRKQKQDVVAVVGFLDIRSKDKPRHWREIFTARGERAHAIITRAIVERIRLKEEWAPPEYGDENEPEKFGKPLNTGGDFEAAKGWDAADNVSTMLVAETGRGKVLKIRTDLARDPWLAYRRRLRMGKADPANPPKIARDTSYASVAGLEGVHFRSEWIKATPGQRYWLVADVKKPGGTPKIFLKGFVDTTDQADGLPESSLAELKLTPEQFAKLSPEKQKKLIADDVRKHPERYRREVYRATLHCHGEKDNTGWQHYALVIPPRGGLPKNIQWLQIQCYAYWPAGEYYFDNVHLYEDPKQKVLAPEVKPRTPGK